MALRLLSSFRPIIRYKGTTLSISRNLSSEILSKSQQSGCSTCESEAQKQSPTPEFEKDQPETPNSSSSLSLPEPGATVNLNGNDGDIKLSQLGPVVVNRNGSLSQISNWEQMSEIERKNTLRILGQRNMLRLQGVKDGGLTH
jgi:hypothetical protein